MSRLEKISSFSWLAVSAAIILGSSKYSFGTWSHPGPGFLPIWCGIIMATFAAITCFQATWRGGKEVRAKEEASFLTSKWPKLVAMLIILMAYAFLLESLGFLAITFIALVCLLKLVGPTRWRTALAEALLATFVSYVLFGLWLKVPLPKGFWPGLF